MITEQVVSKVVYNRQRFEWPLREFYPDAKYTQIPTEDGYLYCVIYVKNGTKDPIRRYVEGYRNYDSERNLLCQNG